MEDLIKEFGIFFINAPFVIQITVGIIFLLFGIIYIAKSPKILKFFHIAQHAKISIKSKKQNLNTHKLFAYLQQFGSMQSKLLDFGDDAKNEILGNILFPLYAEKFSDGLHEFIDGFDFEKTIPELKIELIAKIYEILEDVQTTFINLSSSQNDRNIATFIMKRFEKFNNINMEHAISILEYMIDADNDKTIYDKLESGLFILIVPFENLGQSAVSMFSEMNGDLSGKSYKNIKFNGKRRK